MNLKNIILNFIAKRRIDKGQRLSDTTPQWMITFEIIEYAIEKGNVDAIEYLDISTISESDNSKLIQLAKKAIDKGYKFSFKTPLWIKNIEIIKYAVKRVGPTVINYIDESIDLSKDDLIELGKLVIIKSYSFSKDTPQWMRNFEVIKHAIKYKIGVKPTLIDYIDESTANSKADLIALGKLAINKEYSFSKDTPQWMRNIEIIRYAIEKSKIDVLLYIDESIISKDDIIDLCKLAIDKRLCYYLYAYLPKYSNNIEVINYALDNGIYTAINYLDINLVSDYETLPNIAIDKGYYFSEYTPKWMRNFEVIDYAIDKGNITAIDYLDISTVPSKEVLMKLVKKCINKGYLIKKSSAKFFFNDEIIKYAFMKNSISLMDYPTFSKNFNDIVEFSKEDFKILFNHAKNDFKEEKISFYLVLLTKYNKSSEKDSEIDIHYNYLFDRLQNYMINRFKDGNVVYNYLKLVFNDERNPLYFIYIQDIKNLYYVIRYTDLKTNVAADSIRKIPFEILEKANSDDIKQIFILLRNLNVSDYIIRILAFKIYMSIDLDSANELLNSKNGIFCEKDLIKFFGDIALENLSIKQYGNGIKPQISTSLKDRIIELTKIRPELDFDNPSLSFGLLFDDIVERYGYKFISSLLEFNSGAHLVILKATKDEHDIISKWVNYIKKLSLYNIYGAKLLHLALLSFENCKILINNIINSDIKLNEAQLQNLYEILCQRNIYNVKTIYELTNYEAFIKSKLEEKLISDSLDDVKDTIFNILYNEDLSKIRNFLDSYGLNSDLFMEVLVEDQIINLFEEAEIVLIKAIYDEDDIKRLKNLFDLSTITFFDEITEMQNLKKIEKKIKNYFGNKYKECLFKDDYDKKDGIEFKSIYGIDSEDKNIDGESITSNDTIKVVELNGIDFKLLIHKLHNYDKKFSSYADMIIDKPGLWNKLEGASTLSTSMISSKHMKCVGNGSSDAVYYGFNTISDRSLLLMGPSDIWVEHGGRLLEPTSHLNKFMDPDALQIISKHYNEVALDRKSSDSQKFDHRLQPNCIICFDGKINDASKKAAQYFKIPIYMINREKYKERNSEIYNKYVNHNIDKLDINDVKEILYSKQAELKDRYSLFLELCDYALKQNIVSFEDYIHLLKEGKKIIAYFSMHNNIGDLSIDEIENRITNIQRLLDKEKSSDGIIMEKENENKRKR